MGWSDKLKDAQDNCSHPEPHETSTTLEAKGSKIYEVVTTRCKPCRKITGITRTRKI